MQYNNLITLYVYKVNLFSFFTHASNETSKGSYIGLDNKLSSVYNFWNNAFHILNNKKYLFKLFSKKFLGLKNSNK